jgi:hypothetical protein
MQGKIRISLYSMLFLGSLIYGLNYGESLLAHEWITRFDYLNILLSGFVCSMSLFLLLGVNPSNNNKGGF